VGPHVYLNFKCTAMCILNLVLFSLFFKEKEEFLFALELDHEYFF